MTPRSTANTANVVAGKDRTPIYLAGDVTHFNVSTLRMHGEAIAEFSKALSEARPRLTAWQKRRVLEHIEAYLATPLRNRDLAELVEYSEFHFNVAFRKSAARPALVLNASTPTTIS